MYDPYATYLTPEQVGVLMRPLNPKRVKMLDGLSHLEAWDVRATLTRVFGFGRWDEESVEPPVLLYEQETQTRKGTAAWKVAYRTHRRLTVRDPKGAPLCVYEGSAVGESLMPDFKRGDAHDMAIKTSESQALKRCAINLGTQFGLSLYDDGNTNDVIRVLLVNPESDGDKDIEEAVEAIRIPLPADDNPYE